MPTEMRERILPKVLSELVALGFVLFIIPAIYIFELSVVLPALYNGHGAGDAFWLYFHSAAGTFLMFNLVGNLIGVVLVDTSTKRLIVDSSKVNVDEGWHLCASCETLSPPRAWHCDVCKTCILKREHHCSFTGCCIGFHNFRYFYLFLVHLCAATVYASYFNNWFIWTLVEEVHWTHVLRLLMPVSVLFFGLDLSMTQLYMFYYSVTLIGCLFTAILIYQQSHLLLYNQTSFERNKRSRGYDTGDRWQSVRDSLGCRWYLAAVSPLFRSDLPHGGIAWPASSSARPESAKDQ